MLFCKKTCEGICSVNSYLGDFPAQVICAKACFFLVIFVFVIVLAVLQQPLPRPRPAPPLAGALGVGSPKLMPDERFNTRCRWANPAMFMPMQSWLEKWLCILEELPLHEWDWCVCGDVKRQMIHLSTKISVKGHFRLSFSLSPILFFGGSGSLCKGRSDCQAASKVHHSVLDFFECGA